MDSQRESKPMPIGHERLTMAADAILDTRKDRTVGFSTDELMEAVAFLERLGMVKRAVKRA